MGMMKKSLLLNCYQPPSGKVEVFIDHLHDILDSFSHLDEYEIFLCGDLNIPYNQPSTLGFKKLKVLENKYNLSQLITCPTRCTANSQSILDLILTNSPHIASSGALEINISDHEPVFALRKQKSLKHPLVSFSCRTFSGYVRDDFHADLEHND